MRARKKFGGLFLCLAVMAVLAAAGVNHAISAPADETGTQVQTQVSKPEPSTLEAKKVSDLILTYALVLALFIAIPIITDVILAYHSRNKNWRILIEIARMDSMHGLNKDEFKELVKISSGGPPGISGMSQSLMAFAVIIILGIAMFHLLAYCKDPDSRKIISNVLSMLGATLASITGFYFGGHSATSKGKEEQAPPPPAPETEKVSINGTEARR
jgi:hypothetical protein